MTMTPWPHTAAFAAAVISGAAALAACSFLVTSGRCDNDAECSIRSADAVCRSGACVLATNGPRTDGGADAGPTGDCKENAECVSRLGDYAICEKSHLTCVKLLSPDCTEVYGDYKNDHAIYIGTMFKQGDTAGDLGASPDAIKAIKLAFDEIKNARGGLPDPAGGASRPLVAVMCNQTQDAVRAAKHLAEDVRVPAILGASTSYVTIQIATQVTVSDDVYVISPYASSPGLTTLEDKNLVWRTAPSDAFQAAAIPKLVNEIIADTNFKTPRASRPAGTPVRVGVVYKDDTYGQGLLDIIMNKLAFNGKSAAQNLADGTLQTFSYPNTDDPAYATYDFTEVTTKVISVATPFDIIMLLGTYEATKVFNYAESHWDDGVAPRPYYIMPDGIASAPSLAIAIEDIVTGGVTSKDLRKRIRGTIVNTFSGPVYDAFSLRFQGNAINGSSAYDAAYVLAYALFASGKAGTGHFTGADLAGAMGKLQGAGPSVNVGPNDIATALQGLTSGGITLTGAAAKLNWDLTTGDVTATNTAVWCLGVDAQGKARLVLNTGETYSLATDTMTGTFPDGPTGPDPCAFR